VLELLAAQGVNDVLLEAGATLTGAWLAAGVVDELVVYYAPRLLGDAARPLVQFPLSAQETAGADLTTSPNPPDPLAATPAWRLVDATPVGIDLRVTWRRVAT
jgi:riboflavin biosynthesis pyrimidine reductase